MVLMYTVLLFLILLTLVYLYLTRNFDHWWKRGVPFVKPSLPFGTIEDIILWRKTIGEYCQDVYESTKQPFIGFFILDEPCLLINDLEMIQNVLIKDFDHFRDRSMTTNEKQDSVGSNIIFLMKSPKWTDVRRRMTPAFSSGKMKMMAQLMVNSASNMIDYMRDKINKGQSMEVKDLFARYTIDSITSTSFGLEGDCFQEKDSPFRQIASRVYNWRRIWYSFQISCFFLAPKLVHLLKMRWLDESTSEFFRQIFWRTIKERERTKRTRNDFLDILLEMKRIDNINNVESLDGDVLVAQAAQFFVAGFESTSSTMTFLMIELARNPEIQKKVREDIINSRDRHGGFSYEALQDMEYLESAIYETVRKYPILPFLDRRCNKRYQMPGTDLVLEKGDMIYIPVMGIQYDPEYYPDPHRFDPSRFYMENSDQRNSLGLLGFGAGPRNCIGRRFGILNAKACLASLLSKFEVKSDGVPMGKIKFNAKGVVLQPENDVFLKFEEIH